MATNQFTLYTNKASPFGHYVETALKEAKVQYTRYEIDVHDKPAWFTQINPMGKIPAISYGGPITPPDQPSAESFKLAESVAILEFINEVFPEANLLPQDPKQRATARFCINFVLTIFQTVFMNSMLRRGDPIHVLEAIQQLQLFLPEEKGQLILGNNFCLADAVTGAYLLRVNAFLKNDVGSFPAGEGIKAHEELQSSEKFVKYRAYLSTLLNRGSVVEPFPEDELVQTLGKYASSRRE